MLRRTMIAGILLLALTGLSGAQEDVGQMAVDQQIEILKGLIRQQVSAMGEVDKAKVKAALLELVAEM